MDNLKLAYYDSKFESQFLRSTGMSFQDFFSEIMEKRYPEDFTRIRPWGNVGDRKCDGYLSSKKTLFQVYAPNEMTMAEAIAKIDVDFHDALPFWNNYISSWIFVHNSRQGLSADVKKKLESLKTEEPIMNIVEWGYGEIRNEVLQLSEFELGSLLGAAPSNRIMTQLRYEDIRSVLINVARQESSIEGVIKPVPGNKINHNSLSKNVETMLSSGMRKSNQVRNFFKEHKDPRYGDRITAAYNKKYNELKEQILDPDLIFYELQNFTAGETRSTPEIECAILAILAYFFEECEIFEEPPIKENLLR